MPRSKKIEPVSSEFARADLGDERLNRRLGKIADAVAAAPASSFPKVSGSDELEGIYRFMSNSRVTPRRILAPHFAASRERAGKGDVLVVHDTTSFVFGGDVQREGLGGFKGGLKQGFFGRFALAIAPGESRQPLGLVGLRTLIRYGRPHRSRTPTGTSWEYARWAGLALEVHEALPKAIHVMDREGDSITVFNELGAAGARFVIRCNRNRKLGKSDETGETHLFDALESGEVMLERTVNLSRRGPDRLGGIRRKTFPPRTERTAKLRVRAARVTVKSPPYGHLDPDYPRQITLNAVLVGPNVPKVDLPPNPSAQDALRAVAQLGGHLKRNGDPGWQVLGRGYDSLLLIEFGWMARGARM